MVIAAGSIVRMDIEDIHEMPDVSGNRADENATDVETKIHFINHLLMHDTPPTLLALLDSLCHLTVSSDDPV